ncbi:hypothetical protein K466DRAFT_598515 [Polyporus arcularius HHB13444]|uniref:F-box domain-containing protein n=1 Tax=Polyporus arcularius HHB13444 TaxID=1314778 RepID=A0A5C3PFP0_9APHY|nr:hypothetical protein K466DRAFT_598515 [Polyporus arcularius HHB13444]
MFNVATPAQSLFPGLPRDVSVEIVEHMDVEHLVRLKQTCSLAEDYVAAVIHTRSRKLVDAHLQSYDRFVQMLDSCGAVVGGIGALYILFPYHGRPPFVDIFLPDHSYDAFMEYLAFEEGFAYRRVEPGSDTLPDDDEYSDEGSVDSDDDIVEFIFSQQAPHPALSTKPYPHGVSVMHRFSHGDPNEGAFCINLVRSTTSSPLLPITSELHTALFNYVSPRDFCSSYPALIQSKRALLTPSRLEDYRVPPKHLRRGVAAWARNGWDLAVLEVAYPDGGPCHGTRSTTCGAATRYFGDRYCTRGTVTPARTAENDTRACDNTITVVWWRGGLLCGPGCHAQRRKLVPGARMCLRAVAEGL